MSGRDRRKNRSKPIVSEDFQISTDEIIRNFLQDMSVQKYTFPSNLTNVQRAYVHELARKFGLKSRSTGKEPNRCLNIMKINKLVTIDDFGLDLTAETIQEVRKLLRSFPLSQKELNDVEPYSQTNKDNKENPENASPDDDPIACKTLVRLHDGKPLIPPPPSTSTYEKSRKELPIAEYKQFIINSINDNQVILISGETGCGKTTQLPQFILEDAYRHRKECRVFCTQPRRLSAVAVAERVATERGEPIGQTVGYQIRLESRVSPRTVLTYCTNGVLLRSLMTGMSCLETLTHVIVDEIHERDRFSDFLLICLREILVFNKSLKLILMSATADTAGFQNYFKNLPIILVPGRQYPVSEYYLEDILRTLNYATPAMRKFEKENSAKLKSVTQNTGVPKTSSVANQRHEPQESVPMYDQYILECWTTGSEDAFMQLLYFIMSENASVDYRHSDTGISGLMSAAVYGNLPIVKQFVNLGANVMLTSNNNKTACDWAAAQGHMDVVTFLTMCAAQANCINGQLEEVNNSDMDEHRVHVYNQVVRDEFIDYELVLELILHIHTNFRSGSILCFLAGYDDIITMKNIINEESLRFRKAGTPIVIYTLHSNMQTQNQREVFQPAHNKRKIILSTNIAETSITIEDVVYVIDCGKVKEKNFDAATSVCSLRSAWISQACARQRAGRAGRTSDGVCFHMFSHKRFLSFPQYSTPEILRMPLHELCLQTKMLAPTNMSIADFLSLALEPPSPMVTRTAVEALKTLGALNQDESLTALGLHLVELSIEPHLGKILLYGVLLKCLDPILTIVSSLTYREPFILPAHPSQRHAASTVKIELSAGTYSDHMALLRAFQQWQESVTAPYSDKRFCERNFISSATMEMVTSFRTQLLGQLRAAGFVRNRPPCDIRDLNTHSDNWAVVKAALAAGLYPNIARIDQQRFHLRTQREKKVMFHPSSVLRGSSCRLLSSQQNQINSNLPSEWVIFDEISRNNQICLIRGITLVTAITILLFTGPIYLPLDCVRYNSFSEDEEDFDDDDDIEDPFKDYAKVSLDSWLSFLMHESIINDILQLRVKWHALLLRRMQYPSKFMRVNDENILNCIVEILSIEEQASKFKQPLGIGQRPRPFLPNNSYSRKTQYSNHTSPRPWQDYSKGRNTTNFTPQRSVNKSSNNPQEKLLQALETLPNETATNDDYELDSNASSLFNKLNQVIHEASSISNSLVSLSLSNTPNRRTSVDSICSSTPKKSFNNSPQYKSYYNNFNNKSLDFEYNGRIVTDSDESTSNVGINHGLRYFILKVTNLNMLEISITKKTWIFQSKIEEKFLKLLQDGVRPIIIFTVLGSKHFQGVAQLTGGPRFLNKGTQTIYDIKWISRANLPFENIRHLRNKFNDNRRLNKCPDGQEIDPESGADLVQLFTNIDPEVPVQMDSDHTPPKNGRAIIRRRY